MRSKGLFPTHFYGYDILEDAIQKGHSIIRMTSRFLFIHRWEEIPVTDYLSASGVFNIKLIIPVKNGLTIS
jgi:hypothetical protein